MSGSYTEDPWLPVVEDVLAPWRALLIQHTNDARDGRCPVCQVEDRDQWRRANQRLAEAGGS
jgi:hypothetical protein